MTSPRDSQKVAVYHDRLANSFLLTVSLLMPIMGIVSGFLARQSIFDHNFYISDAVFIGLSLAYIATSAFYFFFRRRHHATLVTALSLISFNIITIFYTLLLTGFVNVFLVAWVPLIVSTDLFFGRVGLLFSLLALVVSGIATAVLYPNLAEPLYLIVLTQEIVAIGVMAWVIATIRRIAEHEGRALVKISAQEELQRERLSSLINSMTDAVVSTDKAGHITIYNAAFLALLDTNNDLTGKNIDEVLRLRNRNNKPVAIMKEASTARKVFSRTDLSHSFADGEEVRLYINVAPIRPDYRSVNEGGLIFVLRDITKEKTLEEEQDEFISVISHELRTPIAIAEGNLSNIQVLRRQGATEETINRVIGNAHEHIMYLAKVINDLGTLSRAEQGVAADAEDLDLKEVVLKVADSYRSEIQQKGLDLTLDLAARLPRVHTGREYLEEIIGNFLSNAIKYTTEGTITLSAHRVDGELRVSVRDTGLGIGKSDQPHIFEKFYRSEDYRTRESSGTGLGLYICARLAHKLGYSIDFSSKLDKGSVFTLVIPHK